MRACFHFKNGKYLSFKTTSHCLLFFSYLYVIKFTNLQINATSHLENIPMLCHIFKYHVTSNFLK